MLEKEYAPGSQCLDGNGVKWHSCRDGEAATGEARLWSGVWNIPVWTNLCCFASQDKRVPELEDFFVSLGWRQIK